MSYFGTVGSLQLVESELWEIYRRVHSKQVPMNGATGSLLAGRHPSDYMYFVGRYAVISLPRYTRYMSFVNLESVQTEP